MALWSHWTLCSLPGTEPSPSSASVPFWSTETIVFAAHFLSCSTDAKTSAKQKRLTTWWPWAHSPQIYWSLRTDKVTLSCYLTINQPETCAQVDHTPWDSTPSPGLLKCFPKKKKKLSRNLSGSSSILSTSYFGLLAWCPTLFFIITQCQ